MIRRPRYARVALGRPEQLLQGGASAEATLVYLRLRLHPAKRSIPGLVLAGEAGLAESLDAPLSATRPCCASSRPAAT